MARPDEKTLNRRQALIEGPSAVRQLGKVWVRWLAQCGVPTDHIVEILGYDLAEVARILEPPRKGPRPWITGPPPRKGTAVIFGPAATKVRRLVALGYDPGRIAAILCIRRADVVDFLRRSRPIRAPKNGSGALTRPRSRVEQKRLKPRRPPAGPVDAWGYRDVDARRQDPAQASPVSAIAAELPELVRADAPVAPVPADRRPATDAADWDRHWGSVRRTGARNARAVLDDAQVAEIRELRAEGLQRDELALMFSCSVATITRITSGRSYTDPPPPPPVEPTIVAAIPPAPPPPAPRPEPDASEWDSPSTDRQRWLHAKLTYEAALQIRELAAQGMSRQDLAERFGVSVSAIRLIILGRTYTAPPDAAD
jgi:ribosome-binding protein aMBF1 (putative translation factor)